LDVLILFVVFVGLFVGSILVGLFKCFGVSVFAELNTNA
jgi:hypothetical protein